MTRDEAIQERMEGEKKPLREWAEIMDFPFNDHLQLYYPDDKPLTRWRAYYVLHNWNGTPCLPDELDKEIEVELVITAKVKVTAAFRVGVMEQYNWPKEEAFDDEKLAKAMLYADLNPRFPSAILNDRFWDGVGNLKGLIKNMKLEE